MAPVYKKCGRHTPLLGPKITHMSRDMRLPTMWYVRPAKAQTSRDHRENYRLVYLTCVLSKRLEHIIRAVT